MMNINTDDRTIKQIIKQELPVLMKKDRKIRQWIIQLASEQVTQKTNEMEARTESKFDIILEDLRKDREAQAKKWEEQNRKWEENREEQNRKWEEQNRKWDEQNRKWEENQNELRKFHEEFEKSRKDFKEELEKSRKHYDQKFDTTLGALGARWGLRSEASFRNGLKGILEDLGLEVEHFEEYDSECIVHDWPGPVEMDIIIKNGILMLCELKSSMSRADIFEFYKKTLFYEKKYNRKGDRLIVISPMVEDKAREAADKLGVKIYSFAEGIQDEYSDHS